MLARSEAPRFDVLTADTPEAALMALACEGVDIILLDLRLPDSEGLETLQRMTTGKWRWKRSGRARAPTW